METAKSPVAAPTSGGAVPLSCQSCRKRKIKCDKQVPCSNCVSASKECVPVVRARLPRGRNGGRKGVNTELRNRINRLEGLVQSLNSSNTGQDHSHTEDASRDAPITNQPPTSSLQDPPYRSRENSESQEGITNSRYMGSSLWNQLASELNGIHAVLEEDDDEEEVAEDTESSPQSGLTDQSTPIDSVLFSAQTSTDILTPSTSEIEEYLTLFKRNVNFTMKFVHLPNFERLLRTKENYLGLSADSPPVQALRSAAFYASTCSITNSHCVSTFGKTKEALRDQWHHTTTHYLAKADISKTNIVTLQALMLYTVALRSHKNDQQSWMLVAISVRTAQAMLLHREESYQGLPLVQAQLYRRAWWGVLALDYQGAMDRGSDVLLPENGYTTKAPSIDLPQQQFSSSSAYANDLDVDTPFFTIHCASNVVLRRLNWVSPGDAQRPPLLLQRSWKARRDTVLELRQNLSQLLSQDHLYQGRESDLLRYACHSFVNVLTKDAELYAFRPLQRHPDFEQPPPGTVNILLIATEALEVKEELVSAMTEPYHWVIKSFVDWHALAVCLAELCTDGHDPQLVQRAWKIADISFEHLSNDIAEGTQGPLWRPMKKLMRSAQRKRQGLSMLLPTQKPAQEMAANPDDAYSAFTNMNLDTTTIMNDQILTDQTWSNEMFDPMETSWLNWQVFTDDLATNNGFGWGAAEFDPVFNSI